jgi:hypothetical protein
MRPDAANGAQVGDIDTRIKGGEKDFFSLLCPNWDTVNS